jgi:hypothetical protein
LFIISGPLNMRSENTFHLLTATGIAIPIRIVPTCVDSRPSVLSPKGPRPTSIMRTVRPDHDLSKVCLRVHPNFIKFCTQGLLCIVCCRVISCFRSKTHHSRQAAAAHWPQQDNVFQTACVPIVHSPDSMETTLQKKCGAFDTSMHPTCFPVS